MLEPYPEPFQTIWEVTEFVRGALGFPTGPIYWLVIATFVFLVIAIVKIIFDRTGNAIVDLLKRVPAFFRALAVNFFYAAKYFWRLMASTKNGASGKTNPHHTPLHKNNDKDILDPTQLAERVRKFLEALPEDVKIRAYTVDVSFEDVQHGYSHRGEVKLIKQDNPPLKKDGDQ